MFEKVGAGGLLARDEPAGYDARAHGHDGAAVGEGAWPAPGGDGALPAGEPAPAAGGDSASDDSREVAELGVTLEEAVGQLDAAIATLAEVELAAETDEVVCAAAEGLGQRIAQLQARLTGLVGEVDRRRAYRHTGALTPAAWYRERVGCDPGQAQQLVSASRRLPRLPRLAAAFADGRVSWAHVTAITRAATPQRQAAIAALEDTLVELAERARPQEVRRALARIRDAHDVDGSESEPLPDAGPDPRRALSVRPTVDGLAELDGPLDPVTAEWLHTLLDAFQQPDPPDTPWHQRRTAAQRRHDALHDLLTKVAAKPETPTVQGARPHVLVMVDVATLAGVDCQATHTPRLRHAGEIAPELARQLATDARVTAVQTMGPWRAVDVGRSHRTLPAWLRDVLHMIHGTCRGPDCDRPATWSQAHHLDEWGEGGHTDLNRTVPLCTGHHRLVTHSGWDVDLDPDTGIATWTSPTGKTIHTHPRPP